jgi:hypothetical protein
MSSVTAKNELCGKSMYTLITNVECTDDGNIAGDGLFIRKSKVFSLGEIVFEGEACCYNGRKYWKWGIEYEEGFPTVEAAVARARELGITPHVHTKCRH